jgi:phage terminase small subunit
MALTGKQALFVKEYLIDRNASRAALAAGYSTRQSGDENMSNPVIAMAIEEATKPLFKKLDLSAEKVLSDIEALRTRCMQGEPVLDNQGNPTGEWRFEANAALRASELQGKYLKLFTDKIEHSGIIGLENLTDEQLDEKIASLQLEKHER